MANVDARLQRLVEALERKKMEQEEPEDDLSRSLFDLGERLARLDNLEKAALLAEANYGDPLDGTDSLNLSMEDLERFIADYQEL